MVRDDEERTARRDQLRVAHVDPARRARDDRQRAVPRTVRAEELVVGDEAAGHDVRGRPEQPAKRADPHATWTPDERLRALARHDPGDLGALCDGGSSYSSSAHRS